MKYLLPLTFLLVILLSACSSDSSGHSAAVAITATQAAQLTATASVYASANAPIIGMTPDQVLNVWGYPEEIHQDDISGEQWVYPNNVFVYFNNGTVSKVQK
jgi:hypothetical protein